jgi:YD repeat-containing protein
MCCETRTPRYHYEDARSPSLLTGITDEANVRTATLGYDAQGRLTSASQAGTSQPLSLAYGSNQTTVTDTSGPNGSSASRIYTIATTASGRLYASSLSAPCSQCGNTAQSTVMGTSAGATGLPTKTVAHDGTVTFYTYDAKGRETEKATFPASFATSTTKPALANATTVTSTQWHGTFNLPTKRAEPNKITAYTYNATTGNLTGQSETQTTDAAGSAKFTATQAAGTPIKSTGWSYNAQQLPTTIVERETAFGATTATETGRTTFTYNSANGNLTQAKVGNEVFALGGYSADGVPSSAVSDQTDISTYVIPWFNNGAVVDSNAASGMTSNGKVTLQQTQTTSRPPKRPDGNPWGWGCGNEFNDHLIPDNYGGDSGADFLPACRAHDVCYGTCNTTKAACDSKFAGDLRAACKSRFGGNILLTNVLNQCNKAATSYYLAVSTGGKGSFDKAQEEACKGCKK